MQISLCPLAFTASYRAETISELYGKGIVIKASIALYGFP